MEKGNLVISLSSGFTFEMILVEGGKFLMGDDKSKYAKEKPSHEVTVSSFYMAKYAVTQELWQSILGEKSFGFPGEKRPADSVSWNKAQDFLKKLNGETRKSFRLPSEAEWEYAARGGKYSQGFQYSGSDKLKQVGWYDENSNEETHEVGLLLANELGLYDMSGNVYEWCADDYHKSYEGAPDDGSAWVDSPGRGPERVLRGGSYFDNAGSCRPPNRFRITPDFQDGSIGFRLVLPLQSVG